MIFLSAETSAADAAGLPSVNFHDRYLIVNADDLGADDGVNRGIIQAHERGIVTSASLMVNMPSAPSAVRESREHRTLSLCLHVNFTSVKRIPQSAGPRALRV